MLAFFAEDPVVRNFLAADVSFKVTDKVSGTSDILQSLPWGIHRKDMC